MKLADVPLSILYETQMPTPGATAQGFENVCSAVQTGVENLCTAAETVLPHAWLSKLRISALGERDVLRSE